MYHPPAPIVSALLACLLAVQSTLALGRPPFVSFEETTTNVILASDGKASPIYIDANDLPGVIRAAGDLQSDIERVSGIKPALHSVGSPAGDDVIIIGTLGRSALIQQLVESGKIDISTIENQWEAWLVQTIANPMPGVGTALVIVGSDKRGTIFGIYEISEQIGVSPWYWWADVPVVHRDSVAVIAGTRVTDKPAIQYRGIFLNDEAPALTGWASETFGGYNHKFYENVFELILRLRGNFLWPAMWGNAFNDDDALNPKVADEYGIVMSTSHHEPMQRAHAEWDRYGEGPWDYSRNEEVLREFWTEGYNRTKQYENIVTLGMRGDGDEPMSEEENVALLERIVADQRKIIAENDVRPLTEINQVWTLYKEVQGYYERGMRVPEDVTLLWSDDNWGNIRRLPTPGELNRSGGAGVYYHFDFVGGPRNYKWLNITPISKVWEQMNLAWEYGAHKIWIVNVGDLKPMEFPIEFFLTLAWAPERWPLERIEEYGVIWAEREFGSEHAEDIARMVATYTKFNRRRSPELLSPDTYSLVNYGEADTIVADYNSLATEAGDLMLELPGQYRDAFFQLVYWPIKACAMVNELNVTVAKNHLYAIQGRASANTMAERARELFAADAELTRVYHEELSDGKWNHFASQAHIGYTYWQQPNAQAMPAVTEIHVPNRADFGVAVEGQSPRGWRSGAFRGSNHSLPPIDVFGDQTRSIEVFSRGSQPVAFTATASQPWVIVHPASGTVADVNKLNVSIDWSRAPHGKSEAQIEINGTGTQRHSVNVPVFYPESPARESIKGFVETDGIVSIEAEHFSRAVGTDGISWNIIPGFGRTLSGVTPFPVTAESKTPTDDSSRLEYAMHLFSTGEVSVRIITAPTMNFVPGRGLRVGISFDDDEPQIVEIHANPDNVQDWELVTAESVRQTVTKHMISNPGEHTLKVWMVDPGMVLQKIVVDLGGERPSYLGPPETFNTVASPADS